MKEELKKDWLSLLEKTNIDKSHYDKVLSYIDMYLVTENLYSKIDVKILPLSMQVFGLIDLNKVEFISYPMDVDDYMVQINGEGNVDTTIVNEISQYINDKLNNGYRVKIYRVIQNINKYDNDMQVHFRMKFYN